jgi:hypothetical protein
MHDGKARGGRSVAVPALLRRTGFDEGEAAGQRDTRTVLLQQITSIGARS